MGNCFIKRSEIIRRLNEMLVKELPQYEEQAKIVMGKVSSKL